MLSRPQISRLLSEKVQKALQRYEAKTRPSRVKAILERIQPAMRERLQAAMDEIARANSAVRQVAEEAGVSACLLPFLLSYGRYVYGRWCRLKGDALIAELDITDRIWHQRGLDPLLLTRVRERVLSELQRLREPV